MPEKMTAPRFRQSKAEGRRLVCLTAYDVASAEMADNAGVDMVLVGDSLGNVVLGHRTTLPVTMADIVHHLGAVRRGVRKALLVADLPFGSYQVSTEAGVRNAVTLMQAGADAVKLEGDYPEVVAQLVRAGIPTMGHVGMTPQSVHQFGGFRVQGRDEAAESVLAVATALEQAGAFGVVLELIPATLAQKLTELLSIPTIGIGAGPHCDGQIQVWHDVLGLGGKVHRHAKAYLEGRALMEQALREYSDEVRDAHFPTEDHSF
ncbi:MAG: 3-methyl-2-oxobutanoate hydroxymethyltransferase [Fimbriimonadaceae bacterium]|nr:3-methyl-2-oxobutanoate hydroxymethyltransferase [Fimbriimonadaceae bacterium]